MQNKALVDDIIRLRQIGASGVIALHHATKAIREKGMSLETVLRGTGDIGAFPDAVYGLLRDAALYDHGAGPSEIDVTCVKPRDFEPPLPFRIAATRKPEISTSMPLGPLSIIDAHADFQMVNRVVAELADTDRLERLIQEDPHMTIEELNQMTGITSWKIRQMLKRRGWIKGRGGAKGAGQWASAKASLEGITAN